MAHFLVYPRLHDVSDTIVRENTILPDAMRVSIENREYAGDGVAIYLNLTLLGFPVLLLVCPTRPSNLFPINSLSYRKKLFFIICPIPGSWQKSQRDYITNDTTKTTEPS